MLEGGNEEMMNMRWKRSKVEGQRKGSLGLSTFRLWTRTFRRFISHNKLIFWSTGLVLAVACFLLLPVASFDDPTATVLTDRQGHLLGARIAADGQWRFPPADSVPDRFAVAVRLYEDEYFFRHPGVNPVSLLRAAFQDIRAGHIVSGGSTLTMQVVRLSRGARRRTLGNKLLEILLALRLEAARSKEEILRMYVSHAPFGGNVVGLDAAAWRYYGRPAWRLSWGETATLAVLPNAPALIYPGRHSRRLLEKHNRLLLKLRDRGYLDTLGCRLAMDEPLPGPPRPLPAVAPHLLQRTIDSGHGGERCVTTLDYRLQQRCNAIIRRHYLQLSGNGIHNAAILVLDARRRTVLAYVGNTPAGDEEGRDVDMITARRSPGSTLKPFLYAAMLDDGLILPGSLIPDIPTHYRDYTPKNFSPVWRGAVPAGQALIQSLNIPAVRMLKDYGLNRFLTLLHRVGFSTLDQPAGHYGLTLILGGGEVTLWDLATAYLGMTWTLDNIRTLGYRYDLSAYRPPRWLAAGALRDTTPRTAGEGVVSAGAIWQTFETLTALRRPTEEGLWQVYSSSKKIAWKTGTSYGFRDAWAVGVTPDYVVAVWVGNADGAGRPGLVGLEAAAPLLFDVFSLLPPHPWFEPPYDELTKVTVCRESGYRATLLCPHRDTLLVPRSGLKVKSCPYHRLVHLDKTGRYRVTSRCYPVADMITRSWFVLPPAQEWYYKKVNPSYRTLPPFLPACHEAEALAMEMIYPRETRQIFIPRDLGGTLSSTVFEVAHRGTGHTIYWHLDGAYLGATTAPHKMELQPAPGRHTLTLIDDEGNILVKRFEVVKK